MTFKITIKEIHEAVVDIDVENYHEALAKVQTDYWKNPNDYLLEPKDTFLSKQTPLLEGGALINILNLIQARPTITPTSTT